MREITKVIIHCSYTLPSMDIGVEEIDEWHKVRGWSGIGYHWVIRRDGTLENGRPIEQVGAHTLNENSDSIGICLVGGMRYIDDTDRVPDFNFTTQQMAVLESLVYNLDREHGSLEKFGHRDFNPLKACPCFDVRAWWNE